MKLFLTITLFLFSFIMYAQDEAMQSEVTTEGNIVFKNGELFTGTLYSDNSANNECKCTLEAEYTNGKLNGIKKEWYNDGILKSESKYKDGELIGEIKKYDSSGNLISNKIVEQVKATENEVTIKDNTIYKNNVLFTGTLYNGDPSKNDCKCRFQAEYINGKLDGIKREWFINGASKSVTNYKNGKLNGEKKEWDENEKLRYKATYDNGIIVSENYVYYTEDLEKIKNDFIQLMTKHYKINLSYPPIKISRIYNNQNEFQMNIDRGKPYIEYDPVNNKIKNITYSNFDGQRYILLYDSNGDGIFDRYLEKNTNLHFYKFKKMDIRKIKVNPKLIATNGFNNETYTYLIDFSTENNIEKMTIVRGLDVKEIFDKYEINKKRDYVLKKFHLEPKSIITIRKPRSSNYSNRSRSSRTTRGYRTSRNRSSRTNYSNNYSRNSTSNFSLHKTIELAKNGDIDSQILLGDYYYNKKDFKNAFYWYSNIPFSYPRVLYRLGIMYRKGLGVKKNRRKAKRSWKESCALGYRQSCEEIKKMNEFGNALLKSVGESIKNYKPKN